MRRASLDDSRSSPTWSAQSALGALSIGHEYTGRTLSLLLTLPARRERLLAIKARCAGGHAADVVGRRGRVRVQRMPATPRTAKQMAALMPVICGLFLAPWLTMACRSPIAGTVFALTIPGVLLVVGELLGVATVRTRACDGSVPNDVRVVRNAGSLRDWRRHELVDVHAARSDRRAAVRKCACQQWLKSASAVRTAAPHLTRHNPVWLLVKKELRLQQMSLVLAALYVLEWLCRLFRWRTCPIWKYGYLFTSLSLPARRSASNADWIVCERRRTPDRHARVAGAPADGRLRSSGLSK